MSLNQSQFKYREESKKKTRDAEEELELSASDGTGRTCPNCHKPINNTCELCPHCGKPVSRDHCTFCGTPFEEDEPFCSECGSPRQGITCPVCGHLSFRSFCSHCNSPLNDNAHQALRLAHADPAFIKAQALYDEMADMETYLQEFAEAIEQAIAEGGDDAPDLPGISSEGQNLQAKYAEIMKLLGKKVATERPKTATPKPAAKKREQIKLKFHDAAKIMEAYKAKAAEMEATLKSMVPTPGMTPQQQRDFVSARKVAVKTTVQKQVPQYWICNYCGCTHSHPSECAEPQLGGKWTYRTITVTEKAWKYIE